MLPLAKLPHKKLLIAHQLAVLVLPLASNLEGFHHFSLLTVVKLMRFAEISLYGLVGDVPDFFPAVKAIL